MNNASILDPVQRGMVESGAGNKGVQAACQLIMSNWDIKSIRDNRNQMILSLMEAGFDVAEPGGARKLTSQLMQQAMWRTMNKLKPHDFEIHGTGRGEDIEMIVKKGIETVLVEGNFVRTLRDKMGVMWNMALLGDGFYLISANPEDGEMPVKFMPVANSNIYVDSYATGIRSGSSPCTQLCVIFSMSYGEACKQFPLMKKKGGSGQIPRQLARNVLKETGRSYLQTVKLDDITEIGFFFDIRNRRYTVFGGTACTVLKDLKDDKYPFVDKDGMPYIPVGQFMCMPAAEGFYNHGLGDILYRLAIVTRQLQNMSIGHAEDSVYPITLVNIAQGEAAKFFNNLQQANKMRQVGKKPVVAIEYDPNNPNSGRVSTQSLLTEALMKEWQDLYEQIAREIRRLGINLDDIEERTDMTEMQIRAQEESTNAWIKQIMEYNASEMEFAVEITMDFIKKFIGKRNKFPINFPTKVRDDEGNEYQPQDITLGMVADELKKNNYYVVVNSRSGAVPSNVMEIQELQSMLSITPPGTEAWMELWQNMARLNNRDVDKKMLIPPQQEQPQGQPGAQNPADLLKGGAMAGMAGQMGLVSRSTPLVESGQPVR
jgi:hypothetical protein